jgi:membrane-associated phospholipid phosphatase
MQHWLHSIDFFVAIRSALITPVMIGFSTLGSSGFLLLFLAVGYWMLSKEIFARMGLWSLLSMLLNGYLKDLFKDPRPDLIFQLDSSALGSYGFPSGHAQIAIVAWLWIAWEVRKTWVWILSSILVIGICFSRLYLGVHDLEDVVAGIGIGLLSLLSFVFLTTRRFEWAQHIRSFWQIVAIGIGEAFFFLTWPGKIPESAGWSGVFLIGFWSGVWIEKKRLAFQKHRDWCRISASAVLGVIIFIALRIAFRTVIDALENGRMVVGLIYALVSGAYVTALAPWIFQNLKLANKCDLND